MIWNLLSFIDLHNRLAWGSKPARRNPSGNLTEGLEQLANTRHSLTYGYARVKHYKQLRGTNGSNGASLVFSLVDFET
jgi:hypothetical protein